MLLYIVRQPQNNNIQLDPKSWWNQEGRGAIAPPPTALCVEMVFYTDISWESRCNIEINVWAHFNKILLVFEGQYQPGVQAKTTKNW